MLYKPDQVLDIYHADQNSMIYNLKIQSDFQQDPNPTHTTFIGVDLFQNRIRSICLSLVNCIIIFFSKYKNYIGYVYHMDKTNKKFR